MKMMENHFKMLKKMILTRKQHAKDLLAGQNAQQTVMLHWILSTIFSEKGTLFNCPLCAPPPPFSLHLRLKPFPLRIRSVVPCTEKKPELILGRVENQANDEGTKARKRTRLAGAGDVANEGNGSLLYKGSRQPCDEGSRRSHYVDDGSFHDGSCYLTIMNIWSLGK